MAFYHVSSLFSIAFRHRSSTVKNDKDVWNSLLPASTNHTASIPVPPPPSSIPTYSTYFLQDGRGLQEAGSWDQPFGQGPNCWRWADSGSEDETEDEDEDEVTSRILSKLGMLIVLNAWCSINSTRATLGVV